MDEQQPVSITPEDLFDWAYHRDSMGEAGYERRAPGDAASVDGPIARSVTCPICERRMQFWPMTSPSGTYYAYAVCEPCDKAMEF